MLDVAETSAHEPTVTIVFVTVYVPGLLADRSTFPVLELTNTNPAVDENTPADPVNVGVTSASVLQYGLVG